MFQKFQFCWIGMTEEDYTDYTAKMENEMMFSGDIIGFVRVGDICVDLSVYSSFQDGPIKTDDDACLCLEFFVGGIDTGYAYTGSGYPYDHAEAASYMTETEMISYDYEEFQEQIKEIITHQLKTAVYDKADLIKKASEEVNVW